MKKKPPTPRKPRRRPYGRVYRRPGGPGWLIQVLDPSGRKAPSGRSAYVTRAVASKAEGEALLKEIRKEILKGTFVSPSAEPEPCELTVAEAVQDFIESRRGGGCAESTLALYGYCLKAFERNGIGQRLVRDLTPRDVEKYMSWRRTHVWQTRGQPGQSPKAVRIEGGTASPATVARGRELLCAAFNRLVRMGQLVENVVAKVPKPKRRVRKRIVLSKAEIARLLAACGKLLRPIVLALVYTGARTGEILRLTWRDISFENATIALYRPKVANFSQIPMHPVVAAELKRIREERGRARGKRVPDSEHCFLSRYGRPFKTFKAAWATAIRRAELADRGVTPHALRHAFACHFLEGGASVTDLQAMLGHASLVTTQIYATMVDQRTRKSVEALDFGDAVNE